MYLKNRLEVRVGKWRTKLNSMDQFQHNSTSQKQFVTLLKDLSQEKKGISSFNILFMLIMYMEKITRFWLAENECILM